MNLYNKYSYNAAFCAFRKIVAETITNYLKNNPDANNSFLCISKYLEIVIVDKDELRMSDDMLEVLNVSDFFVGLKSQTATLDYNRIEGLEVKYIIEPSQKYETKWDILINRMIHDYDCEVFPNDLFEPYIRWKKSEISFNEISLEQIEKMSEEANRLLDIFDVKYPNAHEIHDVFIVDDPWQFTRGYGEDKCLVAYLEYISDQLADLHLRKSY